MTRFALTIIAMAAAAATATAVPATAKPNHDSRWNQQRSKQVSRHNRNARNSGVAYRQGYQDGRRASNNRPVYVIDRTYRGNGRYTSNGYYNNGRRNVSYQSPYWWGPGGQVYCRRSDGTTGLLIGAVAGGTLGNLIANYGDKTLGTVIGGALGGLIGREIERGDARCR